MCEQTLTKLQKHVSAVRGVLAFMGKVDIDGKDKDLVYDPGTGDLRNVTDHLLDMLDDASEWIDQLQRGEAA